jgi:hypothetical protein
LTVATAAEILNTSDLVEMTADGGPEALMMTLAVMPGLRPGRGAG